MKAENTANQHLSDLELEARVCQLVLKRVFDRLFLLVGETKGSPESFSCFSEPLDDLFDNLAGPLSLEWEHGEFNHLERLALGKLLAELRSFYDSQRKHLVLRLTNNSGKHEGITSPSPLSYMEASR